MSTSSSTYVPQKQTILKLSLSGALKDHATENPLASFMGDDLQVLSLSDVLDAIQVAKENPHVAGIYLKAGYFSAGGASLLEIRRALIDFKQSGKFIVAYADNYTQGTYFVCATADKVFLNPQGALGIQGLALETTFYKGLLKKAAFSGSDELIIDGDFLEKGGDSLGTLRYIMELAHWKRLNVVAEVPLTMPR